MSLILKIQQLDGGETIIADVLSCKFRMHATKSVGIAEISFVKGFETVKSAPDFSRSESRSRADRRFEIREVQQHEVPLSATIMDKSGGNISTWTYYSRARDEREQLYQSEFMTGESNFSRIITDAMEKGLKTPDYAPPSMAIPDGLRQKIMSDVAIAQESISVMAARHLAGSTPYNNEPKDKAKAAVARILTDITDWFNAPSPGASPDRVQRVAVGRPWLENLQRFLGRPRDGKVFASIAYAEDIKHLLKKD